MLEDRFGLPVSSASAQAVALNDAATDRLFALQPGAEALADEALALDGDFALAHCTKARALLSRGAAAEGRAFAAQAAELAAVLPPRERGYAQIVRKAVHGEADALALVYAHAAEFPRDAVPLSFALGVYGLLGFGGFRDFPLRQVALLDSVAAAWHEDWWFLAACGWAKVEAGDAGAGIAMLDRALELNPQNANAVHGRAHGYYEQGHAAAGEAFIARWLPSYDRAAVLHGHLAWHQALFALQQGEAERALAIYRDAVAPSASKSLPMFILIDCAAFALRAAICGHPLSREEQQGLAAYAKERFPAPGVPFVNIHLAMAHALAGEWEGLGALREGVAERLQAGSQASGPVVEAVCEAVASFAAQNYAQAAARLAVALPDAARLGGSGAQRDVLIDLAIAAHLRAGEDAAARALAGARWTERASHLDDQWLRRMREARSGCTQS